MTARTDSPKEADVEQVFSAVEFVARPFDFSSDDLVIISSVSRELGDDAPKVNWQRISQENETHYSRIGSPNEEPSLPDGLELREGQAVIVGEVFFTYEPIFFSGFFRTPNLL